MSSKPFTMDFKAFNKDMKKFFKTLAPEQLEKGLFRAASEMLHDADKVEPKTPFEKGDLKGSKHYEPRTDKREISISAGYNLIYAAYQHEKEKGPRSAYNLPGSGPKFLETKMVMFKDKYIGIAVKFLENLLK